MNEYNEKQKFAKINESLISSTYALHTINSICIVRYRYYILYYAIFSFKVKTIPERILERDNIRIYFLLLTQYAILSK